MVKVSQFRQVLFEPSKSQKVQVDDVEWDSGPTTSVFRDFLVCFSILKESDHESEG